MRNLITTTDIPIYRVVSSTTVNNDSSCCAVISTCLPDGTELPQTLYIQFYDLLGNLAWSSSSCPANSCRAYWSRSRPLTWNDATDSWELVDGDITDIADTTGCAVEVTLTLETTGSVLPDSLDCFLSLTGTMRTGSIIDNFSNTTGTGSSGATLDTSVSTFDPLYLVWLANDDQCAGRYVITE